MQTNLPMHLQVIISHADATESLVGQPEDGCYDSSHNFMVDY